MQWILEWRVEAPNVWSVRKWLTLLRWYLRFLRHSDGGCCSLSSYLQLFVEVWHFAALDWHETRLMFFNSSFWRKVVVVVVGFKLIFQYFLKEFSWVRFFSSIFLLPLLMKLHVCHRVIHLGLHDHVSWAGIWICFGRRNNNNNKMQFIYVLLLVITNIFCCCFFIFLRLLLIVSTLSIAVTHFLFNVCDFHWGYYTLLLPINDLFRPVFFGVCVWGLCLVLEPRLVLRIVDWVKNCTKNLKLI